MNTPAITAEAILYDLSPVLSDAELVATLSNLARNRAASIEEIGACIAANCAKAWAGSAGTVRLGSEIFAGIESIRFAIGHFLDWAEHEGLLTMTAAGREMREVEPLHVLETVAA